MVLKFCEAYETLTLRMEEDGDVENDYDTDETEVPDE